MKKWTLSLLITPTKEMLEQYVPLADQGYHFTLDFRGINKTKFISDVMPLMYDFPAGSVHSVLMPFDLYASCLIGGELKELVSVVGNQFVDVYVPNADVSPQILSLYRDSSSLYSLRLLPMSSDALFMLFSRLYYLFYVTGAAIGLGWDMSLLWQFSSVCMFSAMRYFLSSIYISAVSGEKQYCPIAVGFFKDIVDIMSGAKKDCSFVIAYDEKYLASSGLKAYNTLLSLMRECERSSGNTLLVE